MTLPRMTNESLRFVYSSVLNVRHICPDFYSETHSTIFSLRTRHSALDINWNFQDEILNKAHKHFEHPHYRMYEELLQYYVDHEHSPAQQQRPIVFDDLHAVSAVFFLQAL